MNRQHTSNRRQGLTLIELIVVLLILVGLAGLIVPMVPNMLGRTHTAVGAANMKEINKWIQTYEQLNLGFPNNWDSMLDTTGKEVTYLPKDSTGYSGGQIFAASLQNGEAEALINKGITHVWDMVATCSDPNTPTFNPYDSIRQLSANAKVMMLDATVANEKMGLPLNGRYVVFGLGNKCSMVGRVTSEAPIVFADEQGINAADYYARFLAIFQVGEFTTTGMTTTYAPLGLAKFVGSVSLHPGSIDAAGQHIEEFYSIQKTK